MSNENASHTSLEERTDVTTNVYEQTTGDQVIYADITSNEERVGESSFSSNQHQPDVIYSDVAPTQPEAEAIYANNTVV